MPYETLIQNRSVRKQILLTEEDNARLKKVSEATGLSQNEIINKGLSAYLSRYKKYFTTEGKLKENSLYGKMVNN